MADIVFNVAKGWAAGALRATGGTPPGLGYDVGALVLKGVVNDATLRDITTVAGIVSSATGGSGPYTEAQATNYARKVITNAAVNSANGNLAADMLNDRLDLTLPSQTWTSVSASPQESWTKLIVYALPVGGVNLSLWVPLTAHDFTVTTSGGDITASFASGVYRAT